MEDYRFRVWRMSICGGLNLHTCLPTTELPAPFEVVGPRSSQGQLQAEQLWLLGPRVTIRTACRTPVNQPQGGKPSPLGYSVPVDRASLAGIGLAARLAVGNKITILRYHSPHSQAFCSAAH
ncbi:hypothetical protein NHX12_007650 [Muraenolepis orangiensis]|uniref:Uncharacterized protein n=1 Tax=Muraenolepis orangiensis TaxID=630683 RepID=A0A9Q0DQD7_9TELE|nr:hypothetical protein NHX12_007650 [Muraenolepis orangiensis]